MPRVVPQVQQSTLVNGKSAQPPLVACVVVRSKEELKMSKMVSQE